MRANNSSGLNLLLKDLIETTNLLRSGGIEMLINGGKHTIEGALVFVCADALAAHWFGKFKEWVGITEKFCRTCDMTHKDLNKSFLNSKCMYREMNVHLNRFQQLTTLSKAARVYWSKKWDINGTSSLLLIDEFPLVSALVHNPMHIFLEGIVPHELSLMLFQLITIEKLFTVTFWNSALARFRYSYLHTRNSLKISYPSVRMEQSSKLLHLC